MKKEFKLNIPRMEPNMLAKPISQVYEEVNAKCNNFLRTQKGLQYLLMKYPTLTAEQAIREYYVDTWRCEDYDGV